MNFEKRNKEIRPQQELGCRREQLEFVRGCLRQRPRQCALKRKIKYCKQEKDNFQNKLTHLIFVLSFDTNSSKFDSDCEIDEREKVGRNIF